MVLNFSSVQSCRPKREDLSPVVYPNPRSRDKIHRQMYGKVTSWLCNHSLHSFKGFNTVITGTPLRWTTKVGPCNCTLVTHFTVTELPKDKHLVATSSIFKNSKHFRKQLLWKSYTADGFPKNTAFCNISAPIQNNGKVT